MRQKAPGKVGPDFAGYRFILRLEGRFSKAGQYK
jgi:hypothetical protein